MIKPVFHSVVNILLLQITELEGLSFFTCRVTILIESMSLSANHIARICSYTLYVCRVVTASPVQLEQVDLSTTVHSEGVRMWLAAAAQKQASIWEDEWLLQQVSARGSVARALSWLPGKPFSGCEKLTFLFSMWIHVKG